MARYIDADALFIHGAVPFIANDGFATAEKIKEIIAKAPTVFEWIPVTERLPDSQADVLVVAFWHERWQTMIGWHSDMGKKWRVITPTGEFEPGGVTHWMPLPEPPKKETKDSLLFADMEEIIDATD